MITESDIRNNDLKLWKLTLDDNAIWKYKCSQVMLQKHYNYSTIGHLFIKSV